ncbi:MAG: tetratricopeptide repeat protein [Gemmatimonadaceae bacterium]
MEDARALAREALSRLRGSNPDYAIEACDHALGLLLPAGPSDALSDVLRWKGSVLRDRGSHSAAAELYSQSLAVADSLGYQPGRAHALNCLGTVAHFRGDLLAAERWYGESARLAHRLGDRRLSGMVQQNLGVLADVQGRTDEAIAHFRLALVAFEQEEQRDAALWVLNNLGVLYTREGATARALDTLDRARDLACELKDVVSEGTVEENRSALFVEMGRLEAAELAAAHAFGIAEQRSDNTRRAAALRALARVTRARDPESAQALTLLNRAAALADLTEDALLRVEVLSDFGDACRDCGELARARECWRRALDLARLAGFAGVIAGLQTRLRRPSAEETEAVAEATA